MWAALSVLALYTFFSAICFLTWLKDEETAIGIWCMYPVGFIAIVLAALLTSL